MAVPSLTRADMAVGWVNARHKHSATGGRRTISEGLGKT